MDLTSLSYRLRTLTVFRPLLETPVLSSLLTLLEHLESGSPDALTDWATLTAQLQAAGASSLAGWLTDAAAYADVPWARSVEMGEPSPWEDAARRDVSTLADAAALDPTALRALAVDRLPAGAAAVASGLPLWQLGSFPSPEALKEGYRAHGTGFFARCRAFLWEHGQLLPVPCPDSPTPDQLIGYRRQRAQVEANTRALLVGKRVNNVLLFGDSGTGKSATVKSLLCLPGTGDLRLIEIEKDSAALMPQLIRTLAGRRQKFILFIDDLAFDQDDSTYGVLKTILEGGLEPRPANVAIYATSNRRNLVRQTFSDRAGDEVDRGETIQEKTALADRFGLRIPYLSLAKKEYLELVSCLAAQGGIDLPQEELLARAVQWDARHPGRTPRSARQFIDSL